MMTGDRLSAALDAWHVACHQSETQMQGMRRVLAAVDECDRVAGVVRLDTNDDEFATSVALSLGFSARSREHDLRMVRRVFDAIRVAAAGAPEDGDG